MRKDNIRLYYVCKSRMYRGEINREEFFSWMSDIAKRFEGNNEISTKLVEVIPSMVKMKINQDLNETKDVPFIQCENETGEIKAIQIRRHHRIIWGFLQHYCDEAMK